MSSNNNKGLDIKGNVAFPSQLCSFEEKSNEAYGLAVGRAISSEWFYSYSGGENSGSNCLFYTQRQELLTRRMYAKGMQPMTQYYKQMGVNGDGSFLNLSKKPISIIPKCVDIIANGMAKRDYSIKATAIDPLSQMFKSTYRQAKIEDMEAKEFDAKAKELLNVDTSNFPGEEAPDSIEALDFHIDMEQKQSVEISEEMAIEVVLEENRYTERIENLIRKDLIICGVAWAKHRFVPSKGIILDWVDPINKIQSATVDPFFDDTFYDGEFKTTLISEVLSDYPWLNDERYKEQRDQLENASQNWDAYYQIPQNDRLKGTVNLLYFTYRTIRNNAQKVKTKATGEKIISKADESFDENKVKGSLDFDRINLTEEVEFEGVLVLGTSLILKWEVAKNMARPSDENYQRLVRQYVGIAPNREAGYIDSLVARMIPIDDKIQVIELKTEQIIQKITPDGFLIDVSGLVDLDLGDGKILQLQDHFDMLMETGSAFTNSFGAGGDYQGQKVPISELKTGGSLEKLLQLRNERYGKITELKDVIGLNNASDASSPDKDSLVGLQKLAALNSNIATRHILNGTIDLGTRLATGISCRIPDLLKYSPLKKGFIRKIGAKSVKALESIGELPLASFGIYLEMSLDDEERAKLETDLSTEVSKGTIYTEDKYKILSVKNQKYAIAYLGILRKKKQEREEEFKKQQIEAQTQANIQSAQAAEQAKQTTLQMEIEMKKQLQESESQVMMVKIEAESQAKLQQIELEYTKKTELQYVINSGQVQKQEEAEDRKDLRTAKQATQQSELIKQREVNGKPQNFEDKENENQEIDSIFATV
jgi:hypothetical protein